MRTQFRKSAALEFTGFYDLDWMGGYLAQNGSNPDNPPILKILMLTFPRRKLGTRAYPVDVEKAGVETIGFDPGVIGAEAPMEATLRPLTFRPPAV